MLEADKNGDGVISFEEFNEAIAQVLTRSLTDIPKNKMPWV